MKGKPILGIGFFLFRHAIAFVAGVVLVCALWTIAYFALLLYAMATGGGLGGPLAYPAGLLMLPVLWMIIDFGIFMPSCAAGSAICGLLRWPRLAAIPFVILTAIGLCFLMVSLLARNSDMPGLGVWETMLFSALIPPLPLGLYWWLTEGPGAILQLLRKMLTFFLPGLAGAIPAILRTRIS